LGAHSPNTTDLSCTDSHEAVTWLFVGLRD
jgi:hypothetical protein